MWLSRFLLTRFTAALGWRRAPTRQIRRRPPLTAELLEDRTTPATITPTTFADGIGIGSLRDAILQADSNGQNNTIMLGMGSYQLSIAPHGQDAADSGDLNLTAAGFTETIQGVNSGGTVINAAQIDRVFQLMPDVTVVLRSLTVMGGLATGSGSFPGGEALGGGILNDGGNLTLDHVVVTNNEARGGTGLNAEGGGIYSVNGTLTLSNSIITMNSAVGGPGANGNSTGADGGAGGDGKGGGLYVTGGTLTMTATSIVKNQALGGKGGDGANAAMGRPPVVVPPGPGSTGWATSTGGQGPVFTGGPAPTTGPGPVNTGGPAPTNGPGPVNTGGPAPTAGPGPVATGGPAPTGGGGGFTGGGGGVTGGNGGGVTGGGGGATGGNGGWGGGATGGNGGGFTGGGGGATGGGGGTGGAGFGGTGGGGSGGGSLRAAAPAGHGGMGGRGGNAQGGGLYVAGGVLDIQSTVVMSNAVTGGTGGNGGDPTEPSGIGGDGGDGGFSQGGGLYTTLGSINLKGFTFFANEANPSTGGTAGEPGTGAPVNGASQPGQGPDVFIAGVTDNPGIPPSSPATGQGSGGSPTGGTGNIVPSVNPNQDKIGVVRPGPGGVAVFSLDSNGDGQFDSGDAVFQFGLASDTLLTGDWNGSGTDQIGVVRPDGNGSLVFSLDTNGDGQFDAGDQVFHFGAAGDQIIVGDWNGAGKDEIGVVRPDGQGGLVFSLDTNGDGVFDAGDQVFHFGSASDTIVIGDWNGSGKDEIGVVRNDGHGGLVWSLDTNGDGAFDAGDQIYHFGLTGDHPIVGDWNGSGTDKIGVYRPDIAHNTMAFSLDTNGDGSFDGGDQTFEFGLPTDRVVIGKWKVPGQALLAAAPSPSGAAGPNLTAAELAPLLQEATAIWESTGLNAQQIQALQNETITIGALPSGLLGYTRGESITLSPDADGYGWYIDPTPADNAEFPTSTPIGFQAVAGSPAAGHMDLLTTVVHEEGHVLGLPDVNPAVYPDDIMTQTLPTATRRFPRPGEA